MEEEAAGAREPELPGGEEERRVRGGGGGVRAVSGERGAAVKQQKRADEQEWVN